MLAGLNDLNTAISAGAFPSFGCFGYYAPLKQVYLSYRMPVNPDVLNEEYENIRYYLATLYEQLDLFADYIIFLCSCAMTGHGFGIGPAAGHQLAQLIATGKTDVDLSTLRYDRFKAKI